MKKILLALVALAIVLLLAAIPATRERILDASVDTGEAAEFMWHRLTTGFWAKARHLPVTNSVEVVGPFGLAYKLNEYGTPATNSTVAADLPVWKQTTLHSSGER